jgi:hypothetical protein
MYQRILVAIDQSPTSELALKLKEAVQLAKALDATLRLAHVIDDTVAYTTVLSPSAVLTPHELVERPSRITSRWRFCGPVFTQIRRGRIELLCATAHGHRSQRSCLRRNRAGSRALACRSGRDWHARPTRLPTPGPGQRGGRAHSDHIQAGAFGSRHWTVGKLVVGGFKPSYLSPALLRAVPVANSLQVALRVALHHARAVADHEPAGDGISRCE